MKDSKPLELLLDDLSDANGQEMVSVGQLVATFEDRPVGVLVTLFGMLALIPFIGGLPGAPIVISLLTLFTLGKPLFGGNGLWVPKFVANREIGTDKLDKAVEGARPWARRVDNLTSERLEFLVAPQAARIVILAVVALLAISLIPLGLIPGGIAPAALGMLVFGLALSARDGLFALAGYAATGLAIALGFWMV